MDPAFPGYISSICISLHQLRTVRTSPLCIKDGKLLGCVLLLLMSAYGRTINPDMSVGDSCTTPLEDKGECRNIKNCTVLMKILHMDKTFVMNSTCGYEGKEHLVCCPEWSPSCLPWECPDDTITTTFNFHNHNFQETTTTKKPQSYLCGKRSPRSDRIGGGKTATLGDNPWIAALGNKMANDTIVWKCGGSLVSNSHVITAGHCFFNVPDKNGWVVRLGDLNLKKNVPDGASPEDFDVEKITTHPNCKGISKEYDIAIVKLTRAVVYNDYIKPICLPDIPVSLEGQTFIVAGWGATYQDGPLQDILNQIEVDAVDEYDCKNAYHNYTEFVINNHTLCAARPGKDACQGDSGGPLMLNQSNTYYLVGVVSAGRNCSDPNYPGVYTRVSSFMDWIEEVLERGGRLVEMENSISLEENLVDDYI